MAEAKHRVLLVDDDPAVLRAYTRFLTSRGWTVESALDGRQAIDQVRAESFVAIVSDLSMPKMGGLEFLRAVREHDLDVPVDLGDRTPRTRFGHPGPWSTALSAISSSQSTCCCSTRPSDARSTFTRWRRPQATSVGRGWHRARAAWRPSGSGGAVRNGPPHVLDGLSAHRGPLREWRVFGYEALFAGPYEPTLPTPIDMIDAAERLGRVHDLGRAVRARIAADFAKIPDDAKVFVNLHALDLNDDDLFTLPARAWLPSPTGPCWRSPSACPWTA